MSIRLGINVQFFVCVQSAVIDHIADTAVLCVTLVHSNAAGVLHRLNAAVAGFFFRRLSLVVHTLERVINIRLIFRGVVGRLHYFSVSVIVIFVFILVLEIRPDISVHNADICRNCTNSNTNHLYVNITLLVRADSDIISINLRAQHLCAGRRVHIHRAFCYRNT